MNAIVNIYRRLDRTQHRLWFKIAAGVLLLAVVIGYFGSVLMVSGDLNEQYTALREALRDQNLAERDQYAVQFAETGSIVLDGTEYGGPWFAERTANYFDRSGTLDGRRLSSQLVGALRPNWAPSWMLNNEGTARMLLAVGIAWVVAIVLMGLTIPFLLTSIGAGVFVGLSLMFGWEQTAWAFGGIGLLVFTYVLLIRVALLLLGRAGQVASVAHTTIREASRIKIALVFIIGLLLLLPLIPLLIKENTPLRYQVQTYISWSLGLTYYLAAVLTLIFTCATVAFEIRDRQIWQLVTKPLSKFNYLLGKWAGVMMINLALLIVAGVSIFTFTQYLSDRPVVSGETGQLDRLAVQEQVLTARVPAKPAYRLLDAEQLRARVEEQIESDPDLATMPSVPLATRRSMAIELQDEFLKAQRSVPSLRPNQPPQGRDFRFEGLHRAKQLGVPLTMRYRFHILRSDEHQRFPVAFGFNNDPDTLRRQQYVPTMTHTFMVPAEYIQDDGSLVLTVFNLYEPPPREMGTGALHFEDDGMELLYRAGSFEMNFLRAVLVTWIKLAFLAALAICCATFLNFPVALLTACTIFLAGSLGPYLAEALPLWYAKPTRAVDWSNIPDVVVWLTQTITRAIAQVLVFTLSGFGEYKPTQNLVEGKLIPWSAVLGGGLRIGVIWSGLAMIIGYLVMRSRQLAIYSGQG